MPVASDAGHCMRSALCATTATRACSCTATSGYTSSVQDARASLRRCVTFVVALACFHRLIRDWIWMSCATHGGVLSPGIRRMTRRQLSPALSHSPNLIRDASCGCIQSPPRSRMLSAFIRFFIPVESTTGTNTPPPGRTAAVGFFSGRLGCAWRLPLPATDPPFYNITHRQLP